MGTLVGTSVTPAVSALSLARVCDLLRNRVSFKGGSFIIPLPLHF